MSVSPSSVQGCTWYPVIPVFFRNTKSSAYSEGASTSSYLSGSVGKCQCLLMRPRQEPLPRPTNAEGEALLPSPPSASIFCILLWCPVHLCSTTLKPPSQPSHLLVMEGHAETLYPLGCFLRRCSSSLPGQQCGRSREVSPRKAILPNLFYLLLAELKTFLCPGCLKSHQCRVTECGTNSSQMWKTSPVFLQSPFPQWASAPPQCFLMLCCLPIPE